MKRTEYTGTVAINFKDAYNLETRIYDKGLILESLYPEELYTSNSIRNPLEQAYAIATQLKRFPIVLMGKRVGTHALLVERVYSLPEDLMRNLNDYRHVLTHKEVLARLPVLTVEEVFAHALPTIIYTIN